VPIAHTLDRANGEIQIDPEAMLVVTMKKGEPHLLERNNKLTKLTQGDTSVLEQLQSIQKHYKPIVLNKAEELKLSPKDTQQSLVQACGQLEQGHLAYSPKPLPYHQSFVSTDTPQDQYQRQNKKGELVGEPKSYFVGNQTYLTTENPFLKQSKETPNVLTISRNPANQKYLTGDEWDSLGTKRKDKGIEVKPEVIAPKQTKVDVQKPMEPKKETIGEVLRSSKESPHKTSKLEVEVEKKPLDQDKTPKVGKLRENMKMAKFMSQFETTEETKKPELKVKVKN
jgi:hypothetical protein